MILWFYEKQKKYFCDLIYDSNVSMSGFMCSLPLLPSKTVFFKYFKLCHTSHTFCFSLFLWDSMSSNLISYVFFLIVFYVVWTWPLTSDLAGNTPRSWGPGIRFFCILTIISSCPLRSASESCQNSEFTLDKMVHACISHSVLDFSGPDTCLAREHFSLLFQNIFRKYINIFRKQMGIIPTNFSSDIYIQFSCLLLLLFDHVSSQGSYLYSRQGMQPNQELSFSDNCPSGNETKPCTMLQFQKRVLIFMIHTCM